jgi:hypothetical protein
MYSAPAARSRAICPISAVAAPSTLACSCACVIDPAANCWKFCRKSLPPAQMP